MILSNKKFQKIGLFLIFVCLFQLQIKAQINESNYKIYSCKLAKEVSLYEMLTDFKTAEVVFFGEEHNDSVAHYLEKTIFEMMVKEYHKNICLSMEMFDRDVQNVMNEYLTGPFVKKTLQKMHAFGKITAITNLWLSWQKKINWMLFVPMLQVVILI